ncbi:hypothetical protein [Arthrobacter methylotrophus]|uniref:hypothetical protein n=1 Tax=Arthrobacter methylotrophus TaxID=121291 RepID=UPI0031ECD873
MEGLLRKLVPAANYFLYFSRDALALVAIVAFVLRNGTDRKHGPKILFVLALVLWTCVAALPGTDSLSVWVVGIRSYVAPVLFIGLCSLLPEARQLRRIRSTIAMYLPVQAVVVIAQVTSPADSVWNRQISGEEAHFLNEGIARASGTFSAPAGLFGFFLVAVALCLGLLLGGESRDRWTSLLGIFSAVVIVTLAGSRGILTLLLILVLSIFFWLLTNATFSRFILVILIMVGSVLLFISIVLALPQVVDAFNGRLQDASQNEDTLGRLIFTAFGFLGGLGSFFGAGAGHNSQAGIAVGAAGPWIENETIGWVTELGVFGLLLAFLRLIVAARMLLVSFLQSSKTSAVRFMFGIAIVLILVQGTITQNPSSQGAFSILVALYIFGRDSDDRSFER